MKGLRGAVRTLGLDPGGNDREIGIRVALDFWGQTERLDPRQRTLHEALFSAAFKLEQEATQNAPVRTGTRSATRGAAEDMRALAATIVRRAELSSSLSIVAEHLGSYIMKQLSKSGGGVTDPMSLAQAYAMYKAKETVEDDVLVYLYKDMVSSSRFLSSKQADVDVYDAGAKRATGGDPTAPRGAGAHLRFTAECPA